MIEASSARGKWIRYLLLYYVLSFKERIEGSLWGRKRRLIIDNNHNRELSRLPARETISSPLSGQGFSDHELPIPSIPSSSLLSQGRGMGAPFKLRNGGGGGEQVCYEVKRSFVCFK